MKIIETPPGWPADEAAALAVQDELRTASSWTSRGRRPPPAW